MSVVYSSMIVTIINILIVLVVLVFWLGQSLWMYLDARKRNNRFAILWGILGLFSCPVSIIIYLIMTRSNEKKCKNCGKVVENDMAVCPHCGCRLGKVCKNCGAFMKDDWEYCPHCSTKYEKGDN